MSCSTTVLDLLYVSDYILFYGLVLCIGLVTYVDYILCDGLVLFIGLVLCIGLVIYVMDCVICIDVILVIVNHM